MTDKTLSQVENMFHAALDLPAGERDAYLAQVCAGDESLYAEVCSLILEADTHGSFMDKPALNFGLQVLRQAAEESMVGKVLGPYKVLSRLGKGGMGEVYLAEDTKLHRKVALKFLPQELVNDNWAKRQLEKEAQAAARLDHPNICSVYDFENSGEHSFIVMQFVEGETLAELIRKKSINSAKILPLARQIVGALAEAHAHGIIHRDIKPRNIMVTPAGNVKVLDFGLAKTLRPKSLEGLDDSISKFSEIGLVPGTIRYMSPEQLRNERLDYRTDIFSVGTVLYEIVSGTNPFNRNTGPEVISAILSSDPKPLAQNGVVPPKGLESIIRHCLSKKPEERYQSANELLIDLDKPEKGSTFVPAWWRYPFSLRVVRLLTLLLLIVVATAAVLYQKFAFKKHSIAILQLPCEGIPADTCPGSEIRQQLLDHLSRRDFIVEPVNEVHNDASGQSAQMIGSRFGVDAVLSGKIIKRGDALVLKTRLESTANGKTLAENQHVVPSQTIPLVEELSIRVAFNPDSLPTEEDKKTYAILAAAQHRDPDAVELYFRGLYYWNRRDKDNILRAIDSFNQAIERDPAYARAYAGLAECYVMMPTVAFRAMKTQDAMEKAAWAAKKALAIDQNLPEAHTSLGIVQLRYEWNWQAAEKSFMQAIALAPDLASAHYWYSNLLAVIGRLEESRIESERARQLEPLSPLYITNLGKAYYRARDFDKTIGYFRNVLSEDPNNTSAMYMLALAYFQKSMYPEAIELLEKLSNINKWYAAAPLGYAYAKAGRVDDARRILNEMEERSKTEHLPAQERAIVYIGLGDNDSAFYWLEESYKERFGSIIALTTDPFFDSIKSDPRFAVLARKINLVP
jgi:eukaryotic-like serine/threonine-protein kinase